MLSPVQKSAARSAVEGGALRSESKGVMDMNTEFPPLSTSVLPGQHQRQPEPPVISAPAVEGRTERTNQTEDESMVSNVILQQMQPQLRIDVRSSTDVPAEVMTTAPGVPSLEEEKNLTVSASETLLFDSAVNSKENEEDEGDGGGGGMRGSKSATMLPDNEEDVVSSLTVGACPFKVAKPAAAISQSSQQVGTDK